MAFFYRLDKYLWLVRFFVNEYIRFLKDVDFSEEVVDQLNFILLTTALNPDSSKTYHGLVDHMTTVFLDELVKVLGDEWWLLDEDTLLSLFFPWLQLLASCDNGGVVHHLVDELFENLILRYVQVKSLAARTSGESKEARQLRASKTSFLEFVTSVDEAIVELAKDEMTLDKNRKALYNLHSTFQLNTIEKADSEKDSPTKRKEKNTTKKRERPSNTNDDVAPSSELKKSKRSEIESSSASNGKHSKDDSRKTKEDAKKATIDSKNKSSATSSKSKKAMKNDDDSDDSVDSDLADLDDEDALAAIENEFGSDMEEMDFSDEEFEGEDIDFGSDDEDEGMFDDESDDDVVPVKSSKKNGKPQQATPPKKNNFVKMTPSKKTPPKPSSSSKSPASKSPKSPKSPGGSNSSKKVSFNGGHELTERHVAKSNSPAPKSILKPTPAGPVSQDISDATAINSQTEFGAFDYQIPQQQKVLAQPRRITNADRKLLIKKTMLQAMGKKR